MPQLQANVLTVQSDGAIRLAPWILRYTLVDPIIALLYVVDGKSHVCLVRRLSNNVLRMIFPRFMYHLSILARPIVQWARMSLRKAFQYDRVSKRGADKLMRDPQHRWNWKRQKNCEWELAVLRRYVGASFKVEIVPPQDVGGDIRGNVMHLKRLQRVNDLVNI